MAHSELIVELKAEEQRLDTIFKTEKLKTGRGGAREGAGRPKLYSSKAERSEARRIRDRIRRKKSNIIRLRGAQAVLVPKQVPEIIPLPEEVAYEFIPITEDNKST